MLGAPFGLTGWNGTSFGTGTRRGEVGESEKRTHPLQMAQRVGHPRLSQRTKSAPPVLDRGVQLLLGLESLAQRDGCAFAGLHAPPRHLKPAQAQRNYVAYLWRVARERERLAPSAYRRLGFPHPPAWYSRLPKRNALAAIPSTPH